MYKLLSLKLQEGIFEETEKLVDNLSVSRNRYINEALTFYNIWTRRQILKKQLKKESDLVREDSLHMIEEMEKLEDEFDV